MMWAYRQGVLIGTVFQIVRKLLLGATVGKLVNSIQGRFLTCALVKMRDAVVPLPGVGTIIAIVVHPAFLGYTLVSWGMWLLLVYVLTLKVSLGRVLSIGLHLVGAQSAGQWNSRCQLGGLLPDPGPTSLNQFCLCLGPLKKDRPV